MHNSELIKYNLERNHVRLHMHARSSAPHTMQQSTVLHNLTTWEPTSMAVGQGFLAAGGEASQLYVARLSDGRALYNRRVGGTVNNSLHIASNTTGTDML